MKPPTVALVGRGAARPRGASGVGRALLRARLREYLKHDAPLVRELTAAAGIAAAVALRLLGMPRRSLAVLTKVHRRSGVQVIDRVVERLVRAGIGDARPSSWARPALAEHIEAFPRTPATEKFFREPERMLRHRIIVLKSPRPGEKGALLLDYNYAFPFVAKMFDVPRIAERYVLILEPSWSGYCDLDILCYCRFPFPVFVQAYEPLDHAFVRDLGANLRPVPLSANWWVDHRILTPMPGVTKDVDAIMIAGWASYKRHARFFAALAKLRRAGENPRVVLIGYPLDRTRDDVYHEAKHFGVEGSIEMYERLTPAQVNEQLNRAKVNVLWSRKEGVNRAIIEGMFAGVPCVVRKGLNFGFEYPYVNAQTGRFATEDDLPATLLWMRDNHPQFQPRDWVLEHMSCQVATRILDDALREQAGKSGERWTEGLAVKVSHLSGMSYWEPGDDARFAGDYRFLTSTLRPFTPRSRST